MRVQPLQNRPGSVWQEARRVAHWALGAWLATAGFIMYLSAWLPQPHQVLLAAQGPPRVAPAGLAPPAEPEAVQRQPALDALAEQPSSVAGTTAPLAILYYHTTPADFAAQLDYLTAQHYQVFSMDEAVGRLAAGTLPPRSVTITFDDGFADQMDAFALLRQRQLPATFYIINGSPGSHWCIGAGRRYQDPLQPPEGCGDRYLTWDQIREIDRSGLVTMGGHTLDHAYLPALTPDEQLRQIAGSKAETERRLGHAIYHFAYPYGAFDDTTVALVKRAGYASAATTVAGTSQPNSDRFRLHRVRTAYDLPAEILNEHPAAR